MPLDNLAFLDMRSIGYALLAMVIAAVVSLAATPLVKTLAGKVGAVDVPKDNRRMHDHPIPRLGGLVDGSPPGFPIPGIL